MRFFLPDSLLRASLRKRLWLGAAGVAIFIGTIFSLYALTPKPATSHPAIGYDFIAFYTAGRFVLDGRSSELYDLHAVAAYQHELALRNGTDLGTAVGPWWNPPFYAWVFVPLAMLPFPLAMKVWVGINLACFAIAALLLCRILRDAQNRSLSADPTFSPDESGSPLRSDIQPRQVGISAALRHSAFPTLLLVPVLMFLSTPFIHAISHAQNTCTSLLLVTATVTLWRRKRALLAGMVAGLMFYKPQLGAVLAGVLVLDLGLPALAGICITGVVRLTASVALPGSISGFLHQMPANLHFVQDQARYLWERHVTFRAFWRLLIQGSDAGNSTLAVKLLSTTCSAAVGTALVWALVRSKRRAGFNPPSYCSSGGLKPALQYIARDRLIAATISATPLLMPFYFDYDQLLLAIPAVLLAGDIISRGASPLEPSERWLLRIWPIHYAWLMLNPDIALLTRVNFTVPLLVIVVGLLILRAMQWKQPDVASVMKWPLQRFDFAERQAAFAAVPETVEC